MPTPTHDTHGPLDYYPPETPTMNAGVKMGVMGGVGVMGLMGRMGFMKNRLLP